MVQVVGSYLGFEEIGFEFVGFVGYEKIEYLIWSGSMACVAILVLHI